MQCVIILPVRLQSGAVAQGLVLVNPQPADMSACQMVVGSYSEMSSELTRLSPTEGAQIAGAILLLWAIAWTIRVIVRTLNVDERNQNE